MRGKELAKGLTVGRLWVSVMCSSNTYNGFAAVTFQFLHIGNDSGAAQLLIDLNEDSDLREFISVLPVVSGPECSLAGKWSVVRQARLFFKLGGLDGGCADFISIFEQ